MYRNFVKHLIDFILALFVLIVSSPILLIIAILVKLDSPGPIIFRQKRLGKHGKVYEMYKFRTMVVNAEAGGVYSDNKDPRVTRIGNILRRTSLDELPQCINILKGDMSLIGFRPPLTYHPWPFEEYTDEQKRMFAVRPGITGWSQVNGRKTVKWDKRIEMNVWYAEHVSFALDCKIFFMTICKVLTNADNESNGATVDSIPMAEFALCGVLHIYKQTDFFRKNQKEHLWQKSRDLIELFGKKVLIVGCGSVGNECAKRFSAFGCEVLGVDTVQYDNPLYQKIENLSFLPRLVAEADILVLTLPLTDATYHLLDERILSAVKQDCVLVNIARGAIIDPKALEQNLHRFRGAVLDVFEEEPLHSASSLWDAKNVIITPHNSFVGTGNQERLEQIIMKN